MNKWIGIGRIVKKPELNYTQKNTAVTRFSVAVDRPGKDKGVDFITVTAWGREAENICKYMDKGRQIAIEGRIQTGSYEKDGKKVYTTDVVLDRSEYLSGGRTEDRTPKVDEFFDRVDDSEYDFL